MVHSRRLRRAAGPALFPDDTLRAAARSVINSYLHTLERECAAALDGEAGPVHQARVAVRRLRAAVRLFARLLPDPERRALRSEMAWLADTIGAVRDLDVIAAAVGDESLRLARVDRFALDPIEHKLRADRAQAFAAMTEKLRSPRYAELVSRLAGAFAHTAGGETLLGQVAVELVHPLVADLLKAGRKARRDPSVERVHRLRIRGKRLRYALETLNRLGGKALKDALASLVELQESLGASQDVALTIVWLRAAAGSMGAPPATILAVGAMVHALDRRARKLRRRFLKLWRRIEREALRAEQLTPQAVAPPTPVRQLQLVETAQR